MNRRTSDRPRAAPMSAPGKQRLHSRPSTWYRATGSTNGGRTVYPGRHPLCCLRAQPRPAEACLRRYDDAAMRRVDAANRRRYQASDCHDASSPDFSGIARPSAARESRTLSTFFLFAPLKAVTTLRVVTGAPRARKSRTAAICCGSSSGQVRGGSFVLSGASAAGEGTFEAIACWVPVPAGFWNSGRSQRTRPRRSSAARSASLEPLLAGASSRGRVVQC